MEDWMTAEQAKDYNAHAIRNTTIEECARVAENYGGHKIAAAIRALKKTVICHPS